MILLLPDGSSLGLLLQSESLGLFLFGLDALLLNLFGDQIFNILAKSEVDGNELLDLVGVELVVEECLFLQVGPSTEQKMLGFGVDLEEDVAADDEDAWA